MEGVLAEAVSQCQAHSGNGDADSGLPLPSHKAHQVCNRDARSEEKVECRQIRVQSKNTVIRKSFALTVIAGLAVAGPLLAEPDSKTTSDKRPQTVSKQSSSSRDAAAASRVLTVRDISIFTYQPTPTRLLDARALREEGLARLSINQQGVVTAVKIIRSTGRRDYDADAVDAFRRWRTRPGPAREIELPLTSATTGKRGPVRVPTTAGSLTIG
jgi:TonB family protein